MGNRKPIEIELVFAAIDKQRLVSAEVAEGTTARAAILESVLVDEFPAVDFATCQLGIWGRLVADDQVLLPGDRLEAYRPLRRDPRSARRELASLGQSMGKPPRSER